MPSKLKYFALLFCLQFTWNTYSNGQNGDIDSLHLALIEDYAKAFDQICTKGLDLSIKVSTPVRLNYVNTNPSPEELAHIEESKINNTKNACFRDFIYLQNHYAQQIAPIYYQNRDNTDFEKNIDSLVNHGGYTHPVMVKNFLLLTYCHLTLAKYEQDMEEHINSLKIIEPTNGITNEYSDH